MSIRREDQLQPTDHQQDTSQIDFRKGPEILPLTESLEGACEISPTIAHWERWSFERYERKVPDEQFGFERKVKDGLKGNRRSVPLSVVMIYEAIKSDTANDNVDNENALKIWTKYLTDQALGKNPLAPTNLNKNLFQKLFYKKPRGLEDYLSLSFIVENTIRPVTTALEFGFRWLGSWCTSLIQMSYHKTKEATTNRERLGYGVLTFLSAAVLWLPGQALNIVGKTFGYARRTVSAAFGLVSSSLSVLGDGIRWIRNSIYKKEIAKGRKPKWDYKYGDVFPSLSRCAGNLIKNGLLLAANAALITTAVLTAGVSLTAISGAGVTIAAVGQSIPVVSTIMSTLGSVVSSIGTALSAVTPIATGLSSFGVIAQTALLGAAAVATQFFNGVTNKISNVLGPKLSSKIDSGWKWLKTKLKINPEVAKPHSIVNPHNQNAGPAGSVHFRGMLDQDSENPSSQFEKDSEVDKLRGNGLSRSRSSSAGITVTLRQEALGDDDFEGVVAVPPEPAQALTTPIPTSASPAPTSGPPTATVPATAPATAAPTVLSSSFPPLSSKPSGHPETLSQINRFFKWEDAPQLPPPAGRPATDRSGSGPRQEPTLPTVKITQNK